MTKLNVALMQASSLSCSPEQPIHHLGAERSRAAGLGADVLITPELYLSGYGNLPETAARAQPRASQLVRQAGKLAAQHSLNLVLGYPERTDAGLYNSAVIFDLMGTEVQNYRKIVGSKMLRDERMAGHMRCCICSAAPVSFGFPPLA